MIRRPPRSTQSRSSAASDVYKRQVDLPYSSLARLVYTVRVTVSYLGNPVLLLPLIGCRLAVLHGLISGDPFRPALGVIGPRYHFFLSTTGQHQQQQGNAQKYNRYMSDLSHMNNLHPND